MARLQVLTRPGGLYYGWVLVIALGITETISFGILTYAFTVFVRPMQDELGWSRAAISGAFSLAMLVSGLAALPVGRWLDLHGARLIMTVGSVLATALLLAWSSVHDLAAFYLVWFGIGLALAAVLYEPAFAVVATWFSRKRGRALTILTFLGGFASVILLPLAGWLVETEGWRAALVTLAIILGVGTIPVHALVLRRRPEDLGLVPDGVPPAATGGFAPHQVEPSLSTGEALRDSSFWWLALAFFLNSLAVQALFVHLVPYLSDRGFDPSTAAFITGLVGLMALPGRLIFTPLGDFLPRNVVAACLFLLQTLALLGLLLLPGLIGIYAFVLLFGAGFGAITPARAGLVADLYGRTHYARIASFLAFFTILARALGPLGAGAAYDALGDYTPVLWSLVLFSAVSTAAVLLIRRT